MMDDRVGGHNDSIYTQDVNQSMNSGFGTTPKRLNAAEMRKPTAPFQHHSVTDQKNYQRRVPPILLDNANNKKYLGNKHQTMAVGGHNYTAFKSPNNMSPGGGRHGTAAGNSFLSRDAGSTGYEGTDSIFQQSEASISQNRSRFPTGKNSNLPKIGSANPEMRTRFKNAHTEGARIVSTAQPTGAFKSKSLVHSQQVRSRAEAAALNNTGFNWKQVEMNNSTLEGTQNSIHVPRAYRKTKPSPGRMLEMMQEVGHKGPISHKVVSENEFERLAAQQVRKDGGKPMVEKTIFIVKPIYVPVEVPQTAATTKPKEAPDLSTLTGKQRLKLKKKQ